ncbi:MAG TPA: cytochrome c [Vicinamibacterales bacterium]|nr:cytochrome c [Vicinamibacterales bacterium]
MNQKSAVIVLPTFVFAAMLTTGLVNRTVLAQENGKTVADGVYSEAQATRGEASYGTSCSGCHLPDLGGANGPALRGERFARNFAGRDLKTLYTKIATTMPRGATASLSDAVYLDIVAYILRENGFPAAGGELTAEVLSSVHVLPGKAKPPPPVGDFSFVGVVGCLTPGPDSTWLLTSASDPVGLAVTGPGVRQVDATDRPLGTQVFRLLDAMAYGPDAHKGKKMYVKGLLIKLPWEQRMTISALETLAPSCS